MEPKGRKAENEDECPSLQDMVLGLIAEQSDDLKTLLRKNIHHLSEALVLKLLYFTLQKGKLDPDLAATFLSCHHKSVREWIQQRVDMFAYVAITNESDQKSSRVPTGLAKRGLRRAVAPTIVPQTIGTRERVVNLAGYINIKQVTIANGAKSVNGVQLFSAEGLIRSDVDMQLLVTIPFLQAVNLKSFSFDAPAKSEGKKEGESSAPKSIHFFKNQFHMDFSEAQEEKPVMSLDLLRDDLRGRKLRFKSSRFSNVSCLTIFIASNQDDLDVTVFRMLCLYGAPTVGYSVTEPKPVKYRDGPCH